MSNDTEIVKGYQYVTITPASGGFGEYDARYGQDGDIYADTGDLIAACEHIDYVSTEHDDWDGDEDTELVEAIQDMKGSIHYEPEILVAMRYRDAHGEDVVVFGINSLDCTATGPHGEYVPVTE